MTLRSLIGKTTFNGLAIALMGMQLAQRGPAFIDLLQISGTDLQGGSIYVTCANFCYMIGSFVAGYLYNRTRVKFRSLTIAAAIILSGVLTWATPWCTSFPSMLIVLSTTFIFSAIFETTINAEQMRLCDGNSDSAMQFLSFGYSLGAIFGPLVTEPFLAPKVATSDGKKNESLDTRKISPSAADPISFKSQSLNDSLQFNIVSIHPTNELSDGYEFFNSSSRTPTNNSTVTVVNTDYDIRYAFLITALLAFVAAVPFLFFFCRSCKINEEEREEDNEKKRRQNGSGSQPAVSSRELPVKVYIAIVGLGCLYYFLFTACGDSFTLFLTYFVVEQMDWTKEDGALLTAVFWGFDVCAKLALIPLTTRIGTGTILLVSGCATVVFLLGFIAVCLFQVHAGLWIITALLASSVSPCFGGGLAWIDGNLLPLDGKATAAIFVSSAFGASVVPLPVGVLMSDWAPMAFTYVLLTLALCCAVVFVVMLFVVKPLVHRKYGKPRRAFQMDEAVEPTDDGAGGGGGGGGGGGIEGVDGSGDDEGGEDAAMVLYV